MWPPAHEAPIDERWTPADLRHGDLLFTANSTGALAQLGRISDEPWRHVGALTLDANGQGSVIEVLGDRFAQRSLDDFLVAYETYGAIRLGLREDHIAAATDWMAEQVGLDHVYAWDDLILAGLIATTERGLFGSHRDRVRAAIERAAESCKRDLELDGAISLTCSAFVQLAYDTTGGALDTGAADLHGADSATIEHPRWRSADRAGQWPPSAPRLDDLFELSNVEHLELVGEASVFELLISDSSLRRSAGDLRMHPAQFAEVVRVLLAAVVGWADASASGVDRAELFDCRWVTPGDLWRSPTAVARASLDPAPTSP